MARATELRLVVSERLQWWFVDQQQRQIEQKEAAVFAEVGVSALRPRPSAIGGNLT
jgi:hypothetical protein